MLVSKTLEQALLEVEEEEEMSAIRIATTEAQEASTIERKRIKRIEDLALQRLVGFQYNTILYQVQDKYLFRFGKWCYVIYKHVIPPTSTS